MDNLAFHTVTLAFAVLAALIGISQGRKAKNGFRSRSSATYTRAAMVFVIAIAAGIGFSSEIVILVGESLGFALLAFGLVIQGKEADVFLKIAAEQRVDFVSGLPNERMFFERLNAEHSRTKRTNTRYAVAIFEIDGYALLSDGDKLNGMKLLAESLTESVRHTDMLGRIDDQRVAVLLVDTVAEGAIIGCDRACERFFFQSCGHSDHAHVTRPLTLSVGIAAFDEDTVEPSHVVDNAKTALSRLQAELGTGIRVYQREDFVRHADVADVADQAA